MVARVSSVFALLLVCHQSFAETTTVYVSNNGTNSSSCITGGDPCSSFDVAMKLLSMKSWDHITVFICDNQTVLPQVYSLNISSSFTITSCDGNFISLVCSDSSKGLLFMNYPYVFRHPIGTFGLKGLQWVNCLSHKTPGLEIMSFQEVNISNCTSHNSSGLTVSSVQTLTVKGTNFIGSRMTPSAVLLVSGSDANIDEFHFDIRGCNFSGSRKGLGEMSVTHNPGILAFPLAKRNVYYHITIASCVFTNNSAHFLEEVPIIHVPQDNVSLSLDITDCHFQNNRFTFLFLLESELNGMVFFNFSGVKFYYSNSPVNHYGALSIRSSNNKLEEELGLDAIDGNVTILFENSCSFKRCENECLVVNVDFKFMMVLDNCVFKDNKGDGASVIVSCSQYGKKSCKDAELRVRTLKVSKNENSLLSSMQPDRPIPEIAFMEITGVHLHIHNSVFSHNVGTPLALCSVSLTATGNIVFRKNYGIAGGGLVIKKPLVGMGTTLNLSDASANISFVNNYAYYGGAVYVSDARCSYSCQATIVFSGNTARADGNAVYIVDTLSDCNCSVNWSPGDVSFSPQLLQCANVSGGNEVNVFPGMDIVLDVNVTDKDGKPSACYAGIDLLCYDQQGLHMPTICKVTNYSLSLTGLSYSYLTSSTVNTSLRLSSSQPGPYTEPSITAYLIIHCFGSNYSDSLSQSLILRVAACPNGFQFDNKTGMCQCIEDDSTSSNFLCDINLGAACVRKGYWVETTSDSGNLIHARCSYHHCNFNLSSCPMNLEFLQIGPNSSSQCTGNHDGLACSYCQQNTSFSFQAVLCVADSTCRPYALLAFAVGFQVLLSLVLILIMKLRLSVGTGYLYGPLFFLSVVSQLPFSYCEHYNILATVLSAYVSILQLNLKIIGYIPWCFVQSLGGLPNYAFHFLGPSIVVLVVMLVVLLARKCPKVLLSLQSSPLQALCLLALLSFWSIADTCVRILSFSIIKGLPGTRVYLQLNLIYFGSEHLPFAIVSILLLLILVIPFILLLLLSPLLAHRVNFTCIKPILDEFQSCYKDSYRWFSSVYMITWLIVLIVNWNPVAVEIVIVIVATAHFVIHPYQSLWLNSVDSILLVELVLLTGLFSSYETMDSSKGTIILVHVLVAFSLAYITVLLAMMFFGWIGAARWKYRKRLLHLNDYAQQTVTNTEVHLSKSYEEEREPLLRILSEQDSREQ